MNPFREVLCSVLHRLKSSTPHKNIIKLITDALRDMDNPMKIYVAASYLRKAEAEQIAARLTEKGHIITSKWLEQTRAFEGDVEGRNYAIRDFEEIAASDYVVCLTGDSLSSGGRHTEIGIAIGLNVRVFLVGPKESSVFHHHPCVDQVDTVEDLFKIGAF